MLSRAAGLGSKMKYQRTGIAVAAFAAGYILKMLVSPSAPSDLLRTLEKKVAEDFARYEYVSDMMREVSYELKSKARQRPTKQGYADFKDLRLEIVGKREGDIAVVVNKNTHEEQAIQYVNGKMAVGSYMDRLDSVMYETEEAGKHLYFIDDGEKDSASGKLLRLKERGLKIIGDACSYAKEKANSAYRFLKCQKPPLAISWLQPRVRGRFLSMLKNTPRPLGRRFLTGGKK